MILDVLDPMSSIKHLLRLLCFLIDYKRATTLFIPIKVPSLKIKISGSPKLKVEIIDFVSCSNNNTDYKTPERFLRWHIKTFTTYQS